VTCDEWREPEEKRVARQPKVGRFEGVKVGKWERRLSRRRGERGVFSHGLKRIGEDLFPPVGQREETVLPSEKEFGRVWIFGRGHWGKIILLNLPQFAFRLSRRLGCG